jgi:hypothetical protein
MMIVLHPDEDASPAPSFSPPNGSKKYRFYFRKIRVSPHIFSQQPVGNLDTQLSLKRRKKALPHL